MSSERPVSRKPIGELPNGTPMRVIVVDDEFSHRRILVQVLRSAGFDVIAEGVNGEDAIRLVEFYKPRYLFLDYHMPRLDGHEALKRIHAGHPETHVVVCTTDHAKDVVMTLLDAGAVDYIVKPIDRKFVLAKLEKLVARDHKP